MNTSSSSRPLSRVALSGFLLALLAGAALGFPFAVLGFVMSLVVVGIPWHGGSRIDVRSMSRVGRSDVSANAERITTYYLARIAENGG